MVLLRFGQMDGYFSAQREYSLTKRLIKNGESH